MYYDINKKRTEALKQALAGFKDLAALVASYDSDVSRLHSSLQSATLKRLLRVDAADRTGAAFPDIAGAVAEFEKKFSFTKEVCGCVTRQGTSRCQMQCLREVGGARMDRGTAFPYGGRRCSGH